MAHRARFSAAMAAITRNLPFGLSRVVAPSLIGYLVINLGTFGLDLLLLAVFHGGLKLPLPAAVTLSYGSASATAYVLNRVFNFHSHARVGTQFPVFVAVSASNYLIFVLGVTDGLAAAGVYYEFARIAAATCEAIYLYCMFRWVVFRDRGPEAEDPDSQAQDHAEQAPRDGELTVSEPQPTVTAPAQC